MLEVETNENFDWHVNFQSLGMERKTFNDSSLIIAGPSGAGKTTIATKLQRFSSKFSVVPNYTTREARPDDPAGHFKYVSDAEHQRLVESKEFFLARLKKHPRYGYLSGDVRQACIDQRMSIFMFRASGVQKILELGLRPKFVLIEVDAEKTVANSQDVVEAHTEQEAHLINKANFSVIQGCSPTPHFLRIKNHYLGEHELDQHVLSIVDWLGQK